MCGWFIKNFAFLLIRMFPVLLISCVSDKALSKTLAGELYSETTYVPRYGLLTETQVRGLFYTNPKMSLYVGVALQRQDYTSPEKQEPLYIKNLVMATLCSRFQIWKSLGLLVELRTENRSRGGLFFGDIFEYSLAEKSLFSEFYTESFVFPGFHNDPVSTLWFKQGFRFSINKFILLDPYLELYARKSPMPDLGRDTQQARLGARLHYAHDSWNVQILVYESFEKERSSHNEALLVIGGQF